MDNLDGSQEPAFKTSATGFACTSISLSALSFTPFASLHANDDNMNDSAIHVNILPASGSVEG
jgi:hypothetical protein